MQNYLPKNTINNIAFYDDIVNYTELYELLSSKSKSKYTLDFIVTYGNPGVCNTRHCFPLHNEYYDE